MKGKTIRVYLVDGVPTGMRTVDILGWSGKVLVAPRSQLAELARHEECSRTGVYFLVGEDPKDPQRDRVYVGEADNVSKRVALQESTDGNDFWTRTVVVVSTDESLTKAHVRYLESCLIELAHKAGRASVANAKSPPRPHLPVPDVAFMKSFLEQVQLILPVLGFDFLQPTPEVEDRTSPLFVLRKVGVNARAREIEDQFIVLAGSTARAQGPRSWWSYRKLRNQLVEDGKLIESNDPNFLKFSTNVPFSSTSAAAAVVLAANARGPTEWKIDETDETYAAWQNRKLLQAVPDQPTSEGM